jgi:hypothetical protein
MAVSEQRGSDEYEPSPAVPLERARWYGSLRVLPDGRMQFSPWSYKGLPHVSLRVVTDGNIKVFWAGSGVMYLWPLRNRILSACFDFTLTPERLREAVADLRDARGGLDSWVIPALEYSYAQSTVRENRPETFKVIPELLASCHGRRLPVARQWQRVRAQYFINQRVDPPVLPPVEDTPAGKPRGKRPAGKATPGTTTPSKPRKASKGRGTQRR